MVTVYAAGQNKAQKRSIISWSLIISLLLLRGILVFFLSPDAWTYIVYQVGTYLLTAILLWWECKNLKEFHIDVLALWIIVIFKPVQTLILHIWAIDNPLAFPNIFSLFIWLIAIGLAIALWVNRKNLPTFKWKSLGWFGMGTLIGIATAILLAFPMSFQISSPISIPTFISTIKSQAFILFTYQIGYAGISEEPLFRGFLWGMLKKSGWREVWIWLCQAALFILGHLFYLYNIPASSLGPTYFPISFFILIPISSLILGLVVWKARTISATMGMHAAVNTFGFTLGSLAAYFIR